MELDRIDLLARSLASGRSRRRLLGALTAAPLLGGLVTLLDPEDAEGKKRRRRRKDRHRKRKDKDQGKRQRKQRKRACKPKKRRVSAPGRVGSSRTGRRVESPSIAARVPATTLR